MRITHRPVIIFLLSAAGLQAQPFTQSELSWSLGFTNPPCYNEAVSTNGTISDLSPSHNYEGMAFNASSNLTITALGRWVLSGNTNTHSLTLYAELDTTNALASATLITVGASTNQFVYTNITPVGITAGQRYYLVSDEIDIATPRDASYGNFSITSDTRITNACSASITADVPFQAAGDGLDNGTSFKILGCH